LHDPRITVAIPVIIIETEGEKKKKIEENMLSESKNKTWQKRNG